MNIKNPLLSLFTIITLTSYCQNVNFEWAKRIGGTGRDKGQSITVDALGNIYTIGTFEDTVDFDPGPALNNLIAVGEKDIFVCKSDVLGNLIWAKSMGGALRDEAYSTSVDLSGNVYIIGIFTGTADFDPGPSSYNLTAIGYHDTYISKIDFLGNFVWAKKMGGGPTSFCDSFSILTDASGNVYTTGAFGGTVDFDPGSAINNVTCVYVDDIFISKLDSAGNFIWVKTMGGSYSEYGASIALDITGNIYTIGMFEATVDFNPGPAIYNITAIGDHDIFISKLDSAGNFVWAKSMGAVGPFGTSLLNIGNSIFVDSSSNVYTTGSFAGTTDFDPGPTVFNLTATNINDIFISKLDSAGNFVWAKSMGGLNFDEGKSIFADVAGNIYITGLFEKTADFDPGPSVFSLTAAGIWDVFISKLDPTGNLVWAKSMGSTLNDNGLSIIVDPFDNIYTTGFFQGTVDFDPDSSMYNLTSDGDYDIFIHKMSQTATGIGEEAFNQVKIFPNPTKDELNIQVENTVIESIYQLTDITGRPIARGIITEEKSRISLQGLSSGTYLLSIGDEIRKTLKVVKQ